MDQEQLNEDLYYVNKDLYYACSDDDVDKAKELIKAGANVNAENKWGETPLIVAARHGHIEIVKLLIEAGADLETNDDGYTPLDFALMYEHTETVEILKQHGAK